MCRRCKDLRLRLLGPGSSVPSVGIGRVILRIDPSAVPPPSSTHPCNIATNGDENGVPSDRLDMSKVEALIGDAVLSENSRKLFDSMKRQQDTGGPGGSPAGAASLQGLAGMLSMMRPPAPHVRPSAALAPALSDAGAGAGARASAGAAVPPPAVQRPLGTGGMAAGSLAVSVTS